MNMMSLRRRIMGAEKTLLPSAYQQVEYLESTGTQYIDLPFGFLDTDEVEIVGTDLSKANDKFMVSPIAWNNHTNRFAMVGRYNDYYTVGFGSSSTINLISTTRCDDEIHTWTYKNRLFEIVDLSLTFDVSKANFNRETDNLRLFFGYNKNTNGKICSYHHKKLDGTKVNLIPCYRKADQKPGMYDLVSGEFYTNSGTGEFVVGEEV